MQVEPILNAGSSSNKQADPGALVRGAIGPGVKLHSALTTPNKKPPFISTEAAPPKDESLGEDSARIGG